jgi:uncharacterized protein YjbI with pentapeptide repeats
MEKAYFSEKLFEKQSSALEPGEYETCTFVNCDLPEANLSGGTFADCVFKECNLSLAKTTKTAFQNVKFEKCKLLGLRFDQCNPFLFGAIFEGCQLNLSSFYKLNLKNTKFKNSELREADFTEADLTSVIFDHCNLEHATFDNTILEKTDFRTAYNYSLDPDKNRIKKTRFSINGLGGLLSKYDIVIE